MIATLHKFQLIFSRSAFNARREEFYMDLSEAIRDKETLHTFLTGAYEFCQKYSMRGNAQIYALMLKRFQDEEGRLSYMLNTIVPDTDLLAITAIDGLTGNNERADGFLRLAQQIERSKAIKGALLKSVTTSVILVPVIIGFMLLNIKKISAYERMVPDRSRWPGIGQLLGLVADVMTNHLLELVIGIVLLVTLFIFSFKYWCGNLRALADTVLPYSLYRDTHSTNFLMNMASLLRAGKQLVEALNLLSVHASPWLRYHIITILARLNTYPDDYAKAFDTGLFSPSVHLRMVAYGRRDKNFAAAFIRLGTSGVDYVHKQTVKTGQRLTMITVTFSVCCLGFFYFGDYVTSDAIGAIIKAEINQQGDS